MELRYTTRFPAKEDLYALYENLGWNDFLELSSEQLLIAMKQSWYSIYVYSGNKLIATGRIVSDGIINAYLCGLGVDSHFRNRGVGTEISRRLVTHCLKNNLHIQLFCEESVVSYYKKVGLERFAIGMRVKEKVAVQNEQILK
ncbi:TPA: GNAT family N-acetyltransferase [Clostridium botulinum]|uniref:GNAT family N-acetyltransferase n=1 Tax=Clostridium botulinum TaxID=1491 RepID=UPI000D0DC0DA|nr:GNAT family N-acetyltransferase [Clostridium botulinum]PSL98046.1 GNAT family N-acetyltransferase [Clostridium botulinum]HDK7164166.1 GNAT family N-acetyltransferase [Clostridium botulinum]HDK7166178.1 GNAT family N-acetyltransferase [Clostridium botulinum]HDK7171639.1 GNAT family N-acetyltransferase [Clostridium botulinum]HDK7173479.1 GNAT family N-acetyltransferase [Clostridium botulinum]